MSTTAIIFIGIGAFILGLSIGIFLAKIWFQTPIDWSQMEDDMN